MLRDVKYVHVYINMHVYVYMHIHTIYMYNIGNDIMYVITTDV